MMATVPNHGVASRRRSSVVVGVFSCLGDFDFRGSARSPATFERPFVFWPLSAVVQASALDASAAFPREQR